MGALSAIVFYAILLALPQSQSSTRVVRIYFQGDSNLLPDFVQQCEREFPKDGLKVQLMSSDADFQYNVIVAQETTVGSAAAAAFVLDRKGHLVASVVRSGRWSGKGALNATAKELGKKLSVFVP